MRWLSLRLLFCLVSDLQKQKIIKTQAVQSYFTLGWRPGPETV